MFPDRALRLGRSDRPAPTPEILAAMLLVAGGAFALVGLPDVPLMWPMYRLGVVLPSCGLTRGVVEVFRGNLGLAWRFNPGSIVLVGAAAVVLTGAFLGRPVRVRLRSRTKPRPLWTGAVVAVVLVWWAYQQAHADFLIHGRV